MTQTAPEAAPSAAAPDIPSPTVSPENAAAAEPPLDGSPRRRLLISLFLVVSLLGMLACVMPDSTLKAGLLSAVRPYVMVTGLDQRWGMFAPNPRQDTSFVVARTDNVDGSFDLYPLANARGFSEYWNYQWLKYGEQMWSQKDNVRDRAAFAMWVVKQQQDKGRRPVKVTLIRESTMNRPPGPGADTQPRKDIPFFSAAVGAS